MNDKVTRRNFVKVALTSVASVPVLFGLRGIWSNPALAANPPLAETDPQAKSIKYCANAEKDSKKKNSPCAARKEAGKAGQACRGCQLYTKESGEGDKETGKCLIVPGKSVTGDGWCISWVKKP